MHKQEAQVKTDSEQIVLLDDSFRPIGSAPKLASHHDHTPLHLAFSCYVFNSQGKLLITQRAHTKRVWPDVWTNSFCGHPAPGESIEAAILRRGQYEVGLSDLHGLRCVLPHYRYITPPYNGIIENEFCPVYVAQCDGMVSLNPEEVEDYAYVSWDELVHDMMTDPDKYSYWAKEQVKLMNEEVQNTILRPRGSA